MAGFPCAGIEWGEAVEGPIGAASPHVACRDVFPRRAAGVPMILCVASPLLFNSQGQGTVTRTVLVADDERELVGTCERLLRRLGHDSIRAYTGLEALAL